MRSAIIMAVVLAVFTAGLALAQGGDQNITTNLLPEYQTRDGMEKAARQVLAGQASVDSTGKVTVIHSGASKASVRQAEARAKRHADRVAEEANINARRHADAVAGEAVRKAMMSDDVVLKKAKDHTDTEVAAIKPLVAGAATWGKWGVGLSIFAIVAVIVVVIFLARLLRSPSAYSP